MDCCSLSLVILWGVKDGRVCLSPTPLCIFRPRYDSELFCLNFAVGELSYLLSLSRVGMQIGERGDGDGSKFGGTDMQEQLCRTPIVGGRKRVDDPSPFSVIQG